MREELEARAAQAIDLAKAAGAQDVWANANRTRSVEYSMRDAAVEKVQENISRSLSIELYVDGRYSSHSTTDLREERLATFVAEAVALTRALEPDPHRTITDPALFEGRSTVDLELMDASVRDLSGDERLELCAAQSAELEGQEGLISATSGTSDGHNLSVRASSNGFSGHRESTWFWLGSAVTLQGEGDKRPEDWMWGGAPNRAQAPAPQDCARIALERARGRLGTKKGPTKRTLMIVDPRASGSLVRRLLGAAHASAISQGRSFLADKVGQSIAAKALTITENPLLIRGHQSHHYDGEGIAAKPMVMIEGGVLKNLYVDTYYGSKTGLAVTSGMESNREFALGSRDLAGMIAGAKDAIYVTSWLGGNADRTTGDFSFGVRGHLVEGGQIGASVGEMNVTGNLLTLFQQLVEVGNDPWPYSSMLAPTLAFEGVQFSGVS